MAFAESGASFWPGWGLVLGALAVNGVIINLLLAVFNLMPVPPLDGSRILAWLLPAQWAMLLDQVERWGIAVIFALLYFGFFEWIFELLLQPLLNVLL